MIKYIILLSLFFYTPSFATDQEATNCSLDCAAGYEEHVRILNENNSELNQVLIDLVTAHWTQCNDACYALVDKRD